MKTSRHPAKSEFGQELLDIFQEKKSHIMALEQVTEFEPDEQQISAAKYGGVEVIVEKKGQFVFERESASNKENTQPAAEKSRHMVHPSLLKKEIAQMNEGGVEIRPVEDVTPKKKGVKFSSDTPKACRGEKIKLETPNKRQNITPSGSREFGNFGDADFEAQGIMQQISDDFVVDETSMKVLMEGEGFEEHFERQRDFQTPSCEGKKSDASESALRRLSQTVKNKVDKTRRRSSVFLEATTKRLSLSTPKFLKRSKTVSKHPEPSSFFSDVPVVPATKPVITNMAEFEANLAQLQDIYVDMDREVLRDLLIKAGGQLEMAIDLYTAQKIRF